MKLTWHFKTGTEEKDPAFSLKHNTLLKRRPNLRCLHDHNNNNNVKHMRLVYRIKMPARKYKSHNESLSAIQHNRVKNSNNVTVNVCNLIAENQEKPCLFFSWITSKQFSKVQEYSIILWSDLEPQKIRANRKTFM